MPQATPATVRDLAAQLGVSVATVSRVLNGAPNVAPQTRERVRAALESLGSRAPSSRAVPVTRRGTVYVRCPYVLTDYFGLIVSSIAETLALHDRALMLDAGESSQTRHPLSTLPTRVEIAGAILILPPEGVDEIEMLRDRDFPFVIVDPRIEPPSNVIVISAAHVAGARAAAAHLAELGHRRIGVLAGPAEWMATRDRLAGHAAGLAERGILHSPDLVRHAEATIEDGRAAARRLLVAERPTAIVAFNDKMALGALRAARELGLDVPTRLSVIGFDDSDLSIATEPRLTTVRQPLAEMGRIAVGQLVRRLDGHRLDALHVKLATELVVRDSTALVPGQASATSDRM